MLRSGMLRCAAFLLLKDVQASNRARSCSLAPPLSVLLRTSSKDVANKIFSTAASTSRQVCFSPQLGPSTHTPPSISLWMQLDSPNPPSPLRTPSPPQLFSSPPPTFHPP